MGGSGQAAGRRRRRPARRWADSGSWSMRSADLPAHHSMDGSMISRVSAVIIPFGSTNTSAAPHPWRGPVRVALPWSTIEWAVLEAGPSTRVRPPCHRAKPGRGPCRRWAVGGGRWAVGKASPRAADRRRHTVASCVKNGLHGGSPRLGSSQSTDRRGRLLDLTSEGERTPYSAERAALHETAGSQRGPWNSFRS